MKRLLFIVGLMVVGCGTDVPPVDVPVPTGMNEAQPPQPKPQPQQLQQQQPQQYQASIEECTFCETTPTTWRFTISGITASSGHRGESEQTRTQLCPQLNGTYVLKKKTGWWRAAMAPDCLWTCDETINGICPVPGPSEKWALFRRGDQWILESVQDCNVIRYTSKSLNCAGPNVFTLDNFHNFCDGTPSSITITPQ